MSTLLDERIRQAVDDVQARAEQRPSVPVTARRRAAPRRLPLVLGSAAAAAVLVVAGLAITGDESLQIVQTPTALAPPDGFTAKPFEATGMGLRFDVPEDWVEVDSTTVEVEIMAPDRSVIAGLRRFHPFDAVDADGFADERDERVEWDARTEVDGHDAALGTAVFDERGSEITQRVVAIDLGDGTWAALAVSSEDAASVRSLFDWIVSTIEVDLDAGDPAPLLDSLREVEADEGYAFEVLGPWMESGAQEGFEVSYVGIRGYLLASRHPVGHVAVADRVRLLEDTFGARDVVEEETTLDGLRARRYTYRFPAEDGFLATFLTELLIDTPAGDVVQVAVGHAGGLPQEVVDRILQSVRITD